MNQFMNSQDNMTLNNTQNIFFDFNAWSHMNKGKLLNTLKYKGKSFLYLHSPIQAQ